MIQIWRWSDPVHRKSKMLVWFLIVPVLFYSCDY